MNVMKRIDRSKSLTLVVVLLLGILIFLTIYALDAQETVQLADLDVPLADGITGGGIVLELDSAAKIYTGEMPENKPGSRPGIQVPGYNNITIPANTSNVNITLLNPEGNPCYFTFELVLKDNDESLYSSKMVEPSSCIEQIALSKQLTKGEYKATIKIRTYSIEDLVPMNDANVETTLIVV